MEQTAAITNLTGTGVTSAAGSGDRLKRIFTLGTNSVSPSFPTTSSSSKLSYPSHGTRGLPVAGAVVASKCPTSLNTRGRPICHLFGGVQGGGFSLAKEGPPWPFFQKPIKRLFNGPSRQDARRFFAQRPRDSCGNKYYLTIFPKMPKYHDDTNSTFVTNNGFLTRQAAWHSEQSCGFFGRPAGGPNYFTISQKC